MVSVTTPPTCTSLARKDDGLHRVASVSYFGRAGKPTETHSYDSRPVEHDEDTLGEASYLLPFTASVFYVSLSLLPLAKQLGVGYRFKCVLEVHFIELTINTVCSCSTLPFMLAENKADSKHPDAAKYAVANVHKPDIIKVYCAQ